LKQKNFALDDAHPWFGGKTVSQTFRATLVEFDGRDLCVKQLCECRSDQGALAGRRLKNQSKRSR
jgi:hypothetical protein